jgi:hypothetical protein
VTRGAKNRGRSGTRWRTSSHAVSFGARLRRDPPGTRVPAGARPSPILGSLPARDPPRYLDPCRQLPSRARVNPSTDASAFARRPFHFSGPAAGSHAPAPGQARCIGLGKTVSVLQSLVGRRFPRCDGTSTDAIDAWVRTVRAIEDHHSWAPIRPRLATDQASTQWRSLHLVPTTRHRQLDTGSSTPAAQPVPARLPTAATTRRGSADGVRRMRTSWCARPARFAVRSPSPRGPRAAERSAPRGRSRRRSAGDHPGWRTR